jgi:hypothetical protein
MELIML